MPALTFQEMMTNKTGLSLENGVLVLRSPYNGGLVNDCRQIPGREWHSDSKTNTFPRSSIRLVRLLCEKYQLPISDDVAEIPDIEPVVENLPDIEIDDNKILIRFNYDKEKVESIHRVVPGAAWHSGTKTWRTPLANLPQVVGYAKMWNLRLPPGIQEAHERQREIAKELHAASMALDAPIHVNSAVELMPYQRAGVSYLARTKKAILADSVGLGKLHPATEPVLTPTGWKAIGEIRVGDCVIGRNGKPTPVTGIFPQGVQEVVRVTFSDGSWSDCGWDHLWTVCPQNNKGLVLTTRQMYEGEIIERFGEGHNVNKVYKISAAYKSDSGSRRFRIPLVEPVQYVPIELPLDPYTLGVYLGNGNGGSASANLALHGEDGHEIAQWLNGNPNLRPEPDRLVVNVTLGRAVGRTLISLGLGGKRSWEKFIPETYLRSSPMDRLALLQGLMDTDGSAVRDGGGTEYSSTSEALVDGVVELFQSLGGIAKKKGPRITSHPYKGEMRQGRPSWRVNGKLPPHLTPFRVTRKINNWIRPTKYPPIRQIENIQTTGRWEESVCIKVGASDELYVTRSYIVTHNTAQALAAVIENGCLPLVVICPNTLKLNWKLEVEKFFPHLSVTIVSGGKPQPIEPADVVVVNYDICSQRAEDIIRLRPQALVADEAHAIKNTKSKYVCPFCAFKVRVNSKRCPSCRETFGQPKETWTVRRGGGVMQISRAIPPDGMKLLLSGTPVTNRPDELVSQLIAIDRIEDFGGRWRFVQRYGSNKNLKELNRKLRETCMIRRAKSDVFTELPPVRHAKQHLPIETAAMKKYQTIESDVVHYLAQRAREIAEEAGEDGWSAYVEKRMRAEAAEHLVRISVLKNAVSELKFEALVGWIEKFLDNGGEKLVIFGEHVALVERLSERFADISVKVRGGVNNEDRMLAVKRFQEEDAIKLFIGNIAAAGEGLTLTAASDVAIVELPWTFAAVEQCIGRTYGRVSDLHGCTAWYPMVPQTIEDDILGILQQKKKVVDAVTDGTVVESQGSVLADLVAGLAQRGLGIGFRPF